MGEQEKAAELEAGSWALWPTEKATERWWWLAGYWDNLFESLGVGGEELSGAELPTAAGEEAVSLCTVLRASAQRVY